jgi:hypothetical protein
MALMSGRSRGIAFAAALAALAFAAPAAQANVGGFEGGDGDQVAANCSLAVDWQCLSPSQYVATIPSGASDYMFGAGAKEDGIDQWAINSAGTLPSKIDVQGVWSYSSTNAAHDTNFLDLAFNRLSGGGDSYLAFELNQSGAKYTNTANSSITCRTNGDVVISFEVSPKSTVAVHAYKWTWTSGTPCTPGASGSFSVLPTPAATDAELAINAGSIVNYLSTGTFGTSFADGTFGETAVNLTALANAVASTNTCEFFDHMQVTTRSSLSWTSAMGDYVDGGAIAARACQSPSGGGGGGLSLPTVHISTPADNSSFATSTVVLTGTSDQPEVEVLDGNTVVGNAPVDGSGNWTLTLGGVANGSHAYSAVATNSAGSTTSNIVHVTVQIGGSTGGGPSTGGSTTTSAGSTNASDAGAGAGGTKGAAGTKGATKHKKRQFAVCSSKRRFIIRIRAHHARLVSATITVNGRLAKTLRGKRITAPVDLRGLPRGRFVVRIRARAADGHVFTGKRVYHTCAPRKSKRTIPLL